ncbi:major facilitator superfamily domain-containing protein [Xylaria cf. heliscus]|nr:major facilitator superfamily domain-containing protein [Xylaria cf. heliscus]
MSTSPPSNSSDGELPLDIEKTAGLGQTQTQDAASKDIDGDGKWEIEPEPEPETETEPGLKPDFLDVNADGVAGVVSRVLSRISTSASMNPGPPPDGGKTAWLMCLCGHLIITNTWGFINSFGVFQTYYMELLKLPPSDISWIGSITVFLTFFIGTFTGRLVDAGFLRPVLVVGAAFLTLGIFTTSAATQYYQLILSQGLAMGIGSGCLFCAAITTVATYFSTKRSFALGLTASGSVTGGLIYPAMARQLLPSIGFPWTIRAMGFVMLATMIFVLSFMRSRVPPRRTGSIVELSAFRELEYTFYAIGMFLNFLGLYFTFYYLGAFSRSTFIHPSLSYVDSLNLVLILNGIGIFGRLLPNHLADRYGPLNMLAPAALLCGITIFAWMVVDTPTKLYVWTSFYGIVAGGIQSLFPAGLSSLTTDPQKQGTRIGMVFTIVSFATLTGNPIAGAIIAADGGRYNGAQAFTGLSLLLGASFIFGARLFLLSLGASVIGGDLCKPAEGAIPSSAQFSFHAIDVVEWGSLVGLFKEAIELHGRVDHVFANAGMGPVANYVSGIELDDNGDPKEPIDIVLDVNLKGTINTATLAVHYIRQNPNSGSIVVNCSTTGLQRFRAVDYSVAKHGTVGLVRGMHSALAAESVPVRINGVAPSWTGTNMVLETTFKKVGIYTQPPVAVARAVAKLMADESRRGHLIHVDHGVYKEIDEAVLLPTYYTIPHKDTLKEDDAMGQVEKVLKAGQDP